MMTMMVVISQYHGVKVIIATLVVEVNREYVCLKILRTVSITLENKGVVDVVENVPA